MTRRPPRSTRTDTPFAYTTLVRALYRRMNELEDRGAIESFAAELIDRVGKLPAATENLLRLIEIKMYCMKAGIAKASSRERVCQYVSITVVAVPFQRNTKFRI